ncbi:MAG: hypothetical protein ABW185_14405 [Sedimenticola sp.]
MFPIDCSAECQFLVEALRVAHYAQAGKSRPLVKAPLQQEPLLIETGGYPERVYPRECWGTGNEAAVVAPHEGLCVKVFFRVHISTAT